MPISKEVFDAGIMFANPKLIELLRKNKGKAYGLKELQKQFGVTIVVDLLLLAFHGHVESKFINDDTYYHWKGE